jgi:hypothetical protein
MILDDHVLPLPLMPSEVTPWFTALSAYSGKVSQHSLVCADGVSKNTRTNLHQLSAEDELALSAYMFAHEMFTWARRL